VLARNAHAMGRLRGLDTDERESIRDRVMAERSRSALICLQKPLRSTLPAVRFVQTEADKSEPVSEVPEAGDKYVSQDRYWKVCSGSELTARTVCGQIAQRFFPIVPM
jgi:hypothetical protein